ncbi:PREDICTED: UPF0481 protein At3g47200-like [Populus euphratica]|uniref:UPF0481 protein At3g47200-like n=1 Tax=Populus euphratica TaxID=75702 RepID=A0AAJ6UXQ4_POPEU|nr:PREDICTED: UPF0481 protein At3g47200-like [Populus euphratica]XP_011037846.1 PREDICTED: UPF0481 protein At3g47200-like [Populus euphratica]
MKTGEESSEKNNKGDHLSLNIGTVAADVRKALETLGPNPLSDECCIYKVPKRLRVLNDKAYTPQVVCIGPFHRDNKELQEMDEHKRMYLQDFLKWSNASLEDFIELIGGREATLRNCYAETFEDIISEEFVKMILVDAAFVIMVILKQLFHAYRGRNDRIFSCPWKIREVGIDLCLLENQIPFFILQDMLKLSKIFFPYKESKLIILVHEFLKTVWDSWVTDVCMEINSSSEIEHFVDFLRIYQQPTRPRRLKILKRLSTKTAKTLHQAGVKFQSGLDQKLLHIEFDKAFLKIPPFRISDDTEILLRNLQAFEQCHCGDNYVGNYIYMMDLLVDSPEDVEILVRYGIIENLLSNNEAVSTLFYNLSRENMISSKNFYFSDVLDDLNKYYGRDWPKWRANLRQNYFQNPWSIFSVIAAAFLLLLTIIQAVCSIIQLV